jgi:cleavage and polyadenylation specificity factor subunit 1
MTDIEHIPGQEVVTDALSRVESVTVPPSYNALDALQDGDDEVQTLLGSTSALRLEKLPIPGTTVSIYCDTSAGRHQLNVPYGSKCSSPSMICRTWARTCQPCQCSRVSRHTVTPLGNFTPPAAHFLHVHVDLVGPLLTSEGYIYCLTAVDCFTRWPVVIPILEHHS